VNNLKVQILSLITVGLIVILIQFCGMTPSDAPLPLTGSLKISAHIDTVQVDSIFVILDNIPKVLQPNDCIFENIETGKHQVVVSKKDLVSPIDFASVPKLVTVKANETTDVDLALTKLAPNFTLKNLNEQDVTFENYQGKVVLLVFFSHT
jgi:hypothetical protein